MTPQIGILLKNLNNDLQRYSAIEAKKMGLTQVQMSIIDFVYRNEASRELYQTDVEHEFNIQKSSATTLLKLMEKKNLIVRSPSKTDSRYKTILLTAKPRKSAKRIRSFYSTNEEELRADLGPAKDQFVTNLENLSNYMKDKLNQKKRD